ncbi:S9 family peptidase [Opitutus sp. ER46]|uniref:S9 family peptidase n=1 Tax=Opitutus sp. ER46 TaxID=2161864 RepID=UPI000D316009|nr:S9 family peptidase [Opitutus sp. ER46]PTX91508.1 hypothetical protein DB354_16605 [Opitutus sp. ER46]
MKRFLAFLLLGSCVFAADPATPAAAVPPELPVETFFISPKISSLVFSPNGKYIACLVPYEHRLNLAVIDLEKGTKNLVTNFKDKQALQPLWANNDRILFHVDDGGRESYALYAVNRDGSDPSVLASGYSKAGTTQELNLRFAGLLRRLKQDSRNILVRANLTHGDWSDVAKLDLKTAAMRTIVGAPGKVDTYVLDHNDEVRLAVVEEEQIRRVMARDVKTGAWSKLAEHHMDEPGWEPIEFDGDNRTVFIWSDVGRKTKAIYRYDLVERKQLDLVYADDTYDVTDVIYDQSKQKIVGITYDGDRQRFVWLDDEMKALAAKLDASLPNTVHYPRQFSEDGSKIIFASQSDRDPGVYYMYDKAKKKLEEIAVIKPGIDPDRMAPMQPVTFAARDGLTLHGYLTLPLGRKPHGLPLIIHPHGGPFGPRDNWAYNAEVQFYANRGYAVLQIDYRGSGGYGREFEAAGYKRWGLEMQNDLSDGVAWAVAQGIADPKRVVISGASYGGYAAMAGLTFTPELYCAGINYVGVTDIELLIPKAVASGRMYWRHTRLGDLGKSEDRKRIYDTSPVHFADRIQAPVLMAYGKNDPRVVINHGYDMERALKKAGKPYRMIIEKDEGHGFHMEEKKIAFYTEVDAFLKNNVPGLVRVGPEKVIAMPAEEPVKK